MKSFILPMVLTLAALLSSGCRHGLDFQRPAVDAPERWRWNVGEPNDHAPRGQWWQMFGDPALNSVQMAAASGNLDAQAALARVDQARAVARINRSDFLPTLQAPASFVRYRTSGHAPSPVPFPVPSFTQQQWAIPFDLSYELDLWGRVRRSFEAARQLAFGAEAARQAVLLSMHAEVAATYFSLKTVNREIDVLALAIRLRKDALEIFEQRLAAGLGSEFEVERGRVEVASAEADLNSAQRRRAEHINALAVLAGKAPAGFEVTITEGETQLPVIAPGLPSSLLERRPDVAQAERELASRLAQVGVAKIAAFPSVRLTASGGILSGELSDLFLWDSRTWSIGPQISIPIFAGGRNRANLNKARAAYEESVAQYRQKVLVAFREVEDSLAALQFLQGESNARNAAARAAAQAAKLSLERYRAGAVNFLEVVDSENARLQNELARVRIANEQMLAAVRLVKALGGGWEQATDESN